MLSTLELAQVILCIRSFTLIYFGSLLLPPRSHSPTIIPSFIATLRTVQSAGDHKGFRRSLPERRLSSFSEPEELLIDALLMEELMEEDAAATATSIHHC